MKRAFNASLKPFNSFGVDARAAEIISLESQADLDQFANDVGFDPATDIILGDGSNVLFAADVSGKVILNRVKGKTLVQSDGDAVLLDVCGGENWHQLVLWSLEQNLSGLENLSLIPGLAGAAPIQNIGAYGVELADLIDSVEALELASGKYRTFSNRDCEFSYRESRFKSRDKGRFLITRIRLALQRQFKPRLAYAGIEDELQARGITSPTATDISDIVIHIRQSKLPDPKILGNAGSFFKNPVIQLTQAGKLKEQYTDMPLYPLNRDTAKLSAAWLIDRCGWKGKSIGDAAVYDKHALVIVNRGHASGREILDLADAIKDSVYSQFGITLEPEPRIIRP